MFEIINCKNCGEELIKKTYNQEFCKNIACKKQRRSVMARKDYLKHTQRIKDNSKKLRYTNVCKYCSNKFPAYVKSAKFCSNHCYISFMKTTRKGTGNPAYRNGCYENKKSYKSNSVHGFGKNEFVKNREFIKNKMLEQHGYLFCQNCGVNNSIRWETHHIIFRSEKPRHKHLHDTINLIRVCIACHNIFHKDKKTRDFLVKERKLNEIFGDDIL